MHVQVKLPTFAKVNTTNSKLLKYDVPYIVSACHENIGMVIGTFKTVILPLNETPSGIRSTRMVFLPNKVIIITLVHVHVAYRSIVKAQCIYTHKCGTMCVCITENGWLCSHVNGWEFGLRHVVALTR